MGRLILYELSTSPFPNPRPVLDGTNAGTAALQPEVEDGRGGGSAGSTADNGSSSNDAGGGNGVGGVSAAAAAAVAATAVDVDRIRRDTHRLRCRLLPILLRLASDNDWQVSDRVDGAV